MTKGKAVALCGISLFIVSVLAMYISGDRLKDASKFRMCLSYARESLINPDSIIVRRYVAGNRATLSRDDYRALRRTVYNYRSIELIDVLYDQLKPVTSVVLIGYAGMTRAGGYSDGVIECNFLQFETGGTQADQIMVLDVTLDGARFVNGTPEWRTLPHSPRGLIGSFTPGLGDWLFALRHETTRLIDTVTQ